MITNNLRAYGLNPYARAQNKQTGLWFLGLGFLDQRGEKQERFIPRGVLRGRQLTTYLDDLGVDLPQQRSLRDKLINDLRSVKPKKIVLITRRHGWLGLAYVTGREVFGNTAKERVHYDGRKTEQGAGTLESWQREVAAPAASSSLGIFAICAALAPPLLRFTNVENGVFHISGPSGTGKTTVLKVAESVWRNTDELRSWDTSRPALEELLESRNDSFVAIDEIARASSNKAELRGSIAAAAYLIGAGTPRSLSSRHIEEQPSFRVLAISSGEVSAKEIARRVGDARFAGEEARLIDVDIAELANGIFDRLDASKARGAQARLVEGLNKAVKNHYGHAAPAFIARICEDMAYAAEKIAEHMDAFVTKLEVPDNGWARRIAKRFALVYAAGMLAVEWEVVTWEENEVRNAVVRVYRAAQRSAGTGKAQKESMIKDLSLRLDRAVTLKSLKKRDTLPVDSFLCDENAGEVMIATEAFDELADKRTRDALLNDLDNANILVRGRGVQGSGTAFSSQRTVKLSGRKERPYFYVFLDGRFRDHLKTAAV